ncbi:MAG: aldo/keto reductase, partial [Anaerolineae bacterium]|nr:aldo/keto reductase [Anaerolineae bacterium]
MGCWALAGDATWGPQDEADSIATVHAALARGVNMFDTAEGYGGGDSEAMLGRALAGRRDKAVIATKVSRANLSADAVCQACEASLRRLQTDYIDLYQLHWPSRSVLLDETLAAVDRLQAEGKIRAFGVCNFGIGDLSDLLARRQVPCNQLPYSLLWRAVEFEIQPACVANGVGIVCYSPLAQGLLADKFAAPGDVPDGRARTRLFGSHRAQARHGEAGCEAAAFAALEAIRQTCASIGQSMAAVAVAWLLHQPGVVSVIAGARRPAQIEETAAAAEVVLAPDVVAALERATAPVKECVGKNPDMWMGESRFR